MFTPPDTVPAPGPFGPIGPLPLPPAGGSSTPPGDVVRPAADVGVAKVATPDPLARDGRATWHVRITNHGPSRATRVKIRDTLPARARFLRATGAGRCTVRGRVVTCRLRRLRAGRSVQTRIVARLRAGRHAGPLRNTIVADAAQPDPAAANNRDRTSSALAPRLTVRKTVNARTAKLGDMLTYTLRLRNGGPGTARNVVLCDRPGAGLTLRRAPGGRLRRGVACWTIRRLARGRTVRRRVIARVTSNSRPRVSNVATARFEGVRVARHFPGGPCRARPPARCDRLSRSALTSDRRASIRTSPHRIPAADEVQASDGIEPRTAPGEPAVRSRSSSNAAAGLAAPYAKALAASRLRMGRALEQAASSLVAASSRGRSGARTGPVVSPTSRQAVLTAAE